MTISTCLTLDQLPWWSDHPYQNSLPCNQHWSAQHVLSSPCWQLSRHLIHHPHHHPQHVINCLAAQCVCPSPWLLQLSREHVEQPHRLVLISCRGWWWGSVCKSTRGGGNMMSWMMMGMVNQVSAKLSTKGGGYILSRLVLISCRGWWWGDGQVINTNLCGCSICFLLPLITP